MKKVIALLLTLVLALSLVACGPAKPAEPSEPAGNTEGGEAAVDKLDQIKSAGKLVLGTEAFFAPYEFHIMENGVDKIVGFDIDLAQAIADKIGVKLEIVDMAFDSLLLELDKGSVDLCIAGLSPKPERAEVADLSDVYYGGGQSFVIIESNKDKYSGYADFDGLQVAAQMGAIQADLLTANTPNATEVLLPTNDEIVMQLLSGKVEGAFIETIVLEQYQKNYPELVELCPVEYEQEGSVVAIQKGENAAYMALINEVIADMIASGAMAENVESAQKLAEEYGVE